MQTGTTIRIFKYIFGVIHADELFGINKIFLELNIKPNIQSEKLYYKISLAENIKRILNR